MEIKRKKRTRLEEVVPLEAPYIVHIDPCGACNFKCCFCPCNTVDYLADDRHEKMSFQLFKKIADDMTSFRERVKVVNLFAFGEPLLNEKLPDMIKYIKDLNVTEEIRLTSNGYLLSPEINQELINSGLDVINISVEALREEDYFLLCGVRINIKQFIKNIKDLYKRSRKSNLKITIKIVNSMIKSKEDNDLFFSMFSDYADTIFIDEVSEIWNEFKVSETAYAQAEQKYHDDDKIIGYKKCPWPLIEMVVHSNGRVSACCIDWKFETEYGNVKTENLRDIWHSKRLRDYQIKHMREGKDNISFCKTCNYHAYDDIDNTSELILERLISSN